jgi:hypothetical protein
MLVEEVDEVVLSRFSEASAAPLICAGRLSMPICLPVSDRGVTFLDTAEVYGPLTNQEIVGEATGRSATGW